MTPHYAHYGGNLDPNPFSCAAAIITAAEAEAEPKHPPTDQPVGNGSAAPLTDFWPLRRRPSTWPDRPQSFSLISRSLSLSLWVARFGNGQSMFPASSPIVVTIISNCSPLRPPPPLRPKPRNGATIAVNFGINRSGGGILPNFRSSKLLVSVSSFWAIPVVKLAT